MILGILLLLSSSIAYSMDMDTQEDHPAYDISNEHDWTNPTPNSYSLDSRMRSVRFVAHSLSDIHSTIASIASLSNARKANVLHLLQSYIDSANAIVQEVEQANAYDRVAKSKQAEFFLYGFGMARYPIQGMIELLEREARINDNSLDGVTEYFSSLQINSDK